MKVSTSVSLRGSSVGVEFDTSSVRAVEVRRGGAARAHSVALPAGAVAQGEISDPEAMTAALRQLWKEGRFRSRSVTIGLANHQTVARQLTLPALNDRDLRSAVTFELEDQIPFATEECLIDHLVVEHLDGEDGTPKGTRVLAVATLRSSIEQVVAVCRGARLRVRAADPTPFALIRATAPLLHSDAPTAVVQVNEGSLALVVHRDGIPSFARVVMVSGEAASAMSGELEEELERIEQFRRSADGTAASPVALPGERSDPMVETIRATLEYYAIQAGAVPIERLALVGDERVARLHPQLSRVLDLPVALVAPLDPGLPVQDGELVRPQETGSFTGAYGLAVRPRSSADGPSQLELLPERRGAINRMGPVGLAVGSTAASVAILGGLTFLGATDAQVAEDAAATAETAADVATARLAALADARQAADDLRHRQSLADTAATEQIPWNDMLSQIEATRPADTTIVGLAAFGPLEFANGETADGTLTISIDAPSQSSVRPWLDVLDLIPGLIDPWLANSTTAISDDGSVGRTIFTVNATLDPAVIGAGAADDGSTDGAVAGEAADDEAEVGS